MVLLVSNTRAAIDYYNDLRKYDTFGREVLLI